MRTEELIQQLAGDVRPVRPLPRPWKRAAVWTLFAAAYLSVFAVSAFMRRGALAATHSPIEVWQQIAWLATGFTAVVAAFVSVIPGTNRRVVLAPLAPAAVLAGSFGWGLLHDMNRLGNLGLSGQTDWPCVVSITIGGGILWALTAAMLEQGAPLTPKVTAFLAAIGALSVANVEACLTRTHASMAVVLVWHGLTSAAMALAFVWLGRHVFNWPAVGSALKSIESS